MGCRWAKGLAAACGLALSAGVAGMATPAAAQPVAERAPDAVELKTGLRKVEGERFILDLKYRSNDNFLHRDVYSAFGIDACYVHAEVHQRLQRLEPQLRQRRLKLVLFDCYRPLEVQKAMWRIMPDSRYVADPARGSLHNRGIAVDCALAGEDGRTLEFPTGFDSFERKAWQSYACPAAERQRCANRETLKQLMQGVGLDALNSEWWHFQIGNARSYPVIPF